MAWQRGRQLKTVNNGSDTYTYKYDVNGQRLSKTNSITTTSYIYASGLLIRTYNPYLYTTIRGRFHD